jgi:hypothetical protein
MLGGVAGWHAALAFGIYKMVDSTAALGERAAASELFLSIHLSDVQRGEVRFEAHPFTSNTVESII